MANILITGGAGFIGSHLTKYFLDRGDRVIVVDNFISGLRDNLKTFESNQNFTLLELDVCQPLPIIPHKLDAIFHFACPASPNPDSPGSYMRHPVETLMVSTLGSQRLLELAHANMCQIIFASTSEVYGDPLVHPQTEAYWGNVNPNGIRSCYDEGKRAMEALAFSYYRTIGTQIKVVRIFNTYGPHMRLDDGRFTINLIDSYLNKKPFKMFGDGSSTRSFCYIDDLLAGIIKVFDSEKMIGQVVNLGNPNELTLKAAISTFESIIGTSLPTQQCDAPRDDPKKRRPDITKAQQLLGWLPQTDFKTGIKMTLDYYVQQLKSVN